MNLVTKSASLQNVGERRASPAATPTRSAARSTSIAASSDTVAVRLNGMWQDSGVPGRDEVTQKGWGFAPSVGIGLGTPDHA